MSQAGAVIVFLSVLLSTVLVAMCDSVLTLSVITATPIALTKRVNTLVDVKLTIPTNASSSVCVTEVVEAKHQVFVLMAADETLMSRMTLIVGSRRDFFPIQSYKGSCADTVVMLRSVQIWATELGPHSLSITVSTSSNAAATVQIPVVTSLPPTEEPGTSGSLDSPIIKYGGIAVGVAIGLGALICLGRWGWNRLTSVATVRPVSTVHEPNHKLRNLNQLILPASPAVELSLSTIGSRGQSRSVGEGMGPLHPVPFRRSRSTGPFREVFGPTLCELEVAVENRPSQALLS